MSSNAVSKAKETLPAATLDFEADAGQGIEQATTECFAIPMLKVLQSMSPQCDEDDGMEGAKPGMLFNTVTNDLYNGNEGVKIIPCYFKQSFIEWVPRAQGGGYIGEHEPGAAILADKRRNDGGHDVLPNGHEIEDTRNHYCLLLNDDGTFQPVLLSLSITATVASKKWLTRIDNIKKIGKNGVYTPPSYSHIYKLTTLKRENDKGKWYIPDIDMVEEIADPLIYGAAKDLYSKVKAGQVAVRQEDREESHGDTTSSGSNANAGSGLDEDDLPF